VNIPPEPGTEGHYQRRTGNRYSYLYLWVENLLRDTIGLVAGNESRVVVFAFSWLVCDDISSHLNSQQFEEFYMSEDVYWVIELAVNPGRFEDLKTLVAELLEANRNKVGFLTYGVAISDDRQVCHIYERFQDSAAIINHMQSFGPKFSERFFEILKPTRFVIYGTPSAEVKDAVAPFNPVYMTRLADFRKP
jgi:quinol monooxygenase YgiN